MDRGFGGVGADTLVGRNRFIAPIDHATPRTFNSGTRHFAERRNKAIAPYGPEIGAHCVSFNFTNALICAIASSTRASGEIGLN